MCSFSESYVQPRFDLNESSCASFAWNPSEENRLIIVGSNNEISDVSVCERFGIDWNSRGNLIAAFPKRFCEFNELNVAQNDEDETNTVDISYKMKSRAATGYGTDFNNFYQDAMKVCKDEPDLQWLWGWLSRMRAISSEDTETWLYDVK